MACRCEHMQRVGIAKDKRRVEGGGEGEIRVRRKVKIYLHWSEAAFSTGKTSFQIFPGSHSMKVEKKSKHYIQLSEIPPFTKKIACQSFAIARPVEVRAKGKSYVQLSETAFIMEKLACQTFALFCPKTPNCYFILYKIIKF